MSVFAGEEFPAESTAAVAGVIAFLSTATQSTIVRRTKLNVELAKLNRDLSDAVTEIQRRVTALQSGATRSLHNDVQAKLLRINLLLSSQTHFDGTLVDEVKALLQDLDLDVTLPPRQALNFKLGLEDILEFWSGALEIECEVSPEASELLVRDSALVERTFAVLREALTNAAKYSIDGCVKVNFDVADQTKLQLRVRNKFNPTLSDSRVGIGSAILTENATTWAHEDDGDRFVLTAEFASLF